MVRDSSELEGALREHVDGRDAFFLKRELEDAMGLCVSNDPAELREFHAAHRSKPKPVVVMQRCVRSSLLASRSWKARLYLVVHYKDGRVNVYLHPEGQIRYAKDVFDPTDLSSATVIANGYWMRRPENHDICQGFYDDKPKTLAELRGAGA